MQWQQIREQYADHWLLIEAIEAHSEPGMRILDDISVVDTFDDSAVAMKRYVELHEHAPQRELYVVHTDREELDIHEQRKLGNRRIRIRTALSD